MGNEIVSGFNTIGNGIAKAGKTVGNQVAKTSVQGFNTVKKGGEAIGTGAVGIGKTVGGGVVYATTGNDNLVKNGIGDIKKAGNKFVDFFTGKGTVKVNANGNISRPFCDIPFHVSNPDVNITEGLLGSALDPILKILQAAFISQLLKDEVRTQLNGTSKAFKKQLKSNLGFNTGMDSVIDTKTKELWRPEDLKCRFIDGDHLYAWLEKDTSKAFPDKIKMKWKTCVTVSQKKLRCEIQLDTSRRMLLHIHIKGVKSLLDEVKGNVRQKIKNKIGGCCERCSVEIVPHNENISIAVSVWLHV
eukprot:710653_1